VAERVAEAVRILPHGKGGSRWGGVKKQKRGLAMACLPTIEGLRGKTVGNGAVGSDTTNNGMTFVEDRR